MIGVMRLIMDDRKLRTLEQIEEFLEGNNVVEFKRLEGDKQYEWIGLVLRRFNYPELRRHQKGMIRRYLQKVTGYSRAQVCRLMRRYDREGGAKAIPSSSFPGEIHSSGYGTTGEDR